MLGHRQALERGAGVVMPRRDVLQVNDECRVTLQQHLEILRLADVVLVVRPLHFLLEHVACHVAGEFAIPQGQTMLAPWRKGGDIERIYPMPRSSAFLASFTDTRLMMLWHHG